MYIHFNKLNNYFYCKIMNVVLIKPISLNNNFNLLNNKQPKKVSIEFILEHNNKSQIKRNNSVKNSQLAYVDNIESNTKNGLSKIKRSRYINL